MLWLRAYHKMILRLLIVRLERHMLGTRVELEQNRGLEVEACSMVHFIPMIIWAMTEDIVVAAVIVATSKLNVVQVCFSSSYLIGITRILYVDILQLIV